MPNLRDRDGVWWCDAYHLDETGRRKRVQRSTGIKNDGTRTAQRTAEKVARDIESALADGRGRRVRGITLAAAFIRRVEAQRLVGASPASVKITLEKSAHTLDYFGSGRDVLNEPITTEQLKAYATQARASRAIATVTREIIELRCALREAKATLPDMPALGRAEPKEIWLDNAQSEVLIANLAPSRRDHAIVYRLTGARWSELYRMAVPDVFVAGGDMLRIRGTKTRTDARGGADRTIPMHPQVADILARRVRAAKAEGRLALFSPGETWNYGNGNRDLTAAAIRAGIKVNGQDVGASGMRVSFNVLRASFCTELVLAGVPLKKVAYMLGHKTTAMVELVYTRFFGGDVGLNLGDILGALGPFEDRHEYATDVTRQAHPLDAPSPENEDK